MKAEDRSALVARSLFREANDAFFLFDPESLSVLDVNPAALRLLGLERRAVLRMRLADLFSTPGPGGLDRLIQALEQTGFFHSREGYLLKRATGEDLAVNLSVSRIHLEPETIGLVVARDISEHRRAEEALRRAEARYHSLIELTGVVVWELDIEGRVLSLGPAFEEITGWTPGEWIGRPFDDLVHPDDREEARRLLALSIQGGILPRFEFRIVGRHGAVSHGEFVLVARVREGRDDRILGIVRDVTEQKRVQQALEQARLLERAKEAAEQANRAKTEFLSKVSHDLRTPLSAIIGFTELLSEHPFLGAAPAEVHDSLATVRGNSRLLLRLIDDLLDISRIEAGQLRLERGPCSLAQVISGVLESLPPTTQDGPVSIDVDLSPSIPRTIVVDQLRLRQILMNLIDNALKFTAEGSIRVAAELGDRLESGPTLRLTVSDTGIGMTEDEMSRLFEPFNRGRRDGPGGTGLGLTICKRLATRLGGELTVTSRPGAGSTFTLVVPVEIGITPEQGRDEVPRNPPGPGSPSLVPTPRIARILLAEDHEANRQVLTTRLSRAGYEVIQARNGKEALDHVRDSADRGQPFSAVIMDMEMPVLDGYEAVRRLRAEGFDAPILAVTAFAMRQDREECLRLGCDEHISKPVEWDLFFRKLARLLDERAGHPSSDGSSIAPAV